MGYDYRYLKPKEAERLKMSVAKVGLDDRKLGYRRIEGAVIAPGKYSGGVFSGGNLVDGTRMHRLIHDVTDIPEPKHFCEETVIFLGVFHACWGHAISDCLKHLWFLIEGLPPEYQGLSFVYTTQEIGETLPENFFVALKLLGVDMSTARRVDAPTCFSHCIVPDECFLAQEDDFAWAYPGVGLRVPHPEYVGLIDRIMERSGAVSKSEPTRKVYFSRTKFKRWEYGEDVVEKAFAEKGFDIVHPEELSLSQMISVLSETAVFAATEGSCAHNAIFLRRGAKAIIIRKTNYTNWHQLTFNFIRQLDVIYIRSAISPAFLRYESNTPSQGPFFIYVNNRLATLLGVRTCFPIKTFARYLCWSVTLHWGHLIFSGLRRLRH